MIETKILHNPRCGKSRQTLKLLHERGENVQVVEYLKFCPSYDELKNIIQKTGMKPFEIIRKGESVYKENYKGKELSDDQWIEAMVEHPILIERPIVIKGDKAALGRPPEKVEAIL
ncbi:MAG: arsenate reductase (glutaredoxin) [Cyclobacteriaceae bacterium]